MRFFGAMGTLVFVGLAAGAGPAEPVTVTAAQGAKQPQAAVDEEGRIHVVFGSGTEIRYTVSADLGRSFAAPTLVGSVEGLALGMRRGPRIAASAGAVVVTAIGHTTGDLLAWRSTDGGKSWAGPTRVNAVPASAREGLHAMADRPDGTVFCTWLDLRDKGTQIFGARSLDGGESWERDRLVYRSPDRTVCECCHPSATFAPDGTLYVMWRNQIRGDRDLYLTSSTDRGESFGRARKLGEGTWHLKACPMDGGAVAAGPDGAVETAWRRADDVFLAGPGGRERHLGRGQQPWAAWGPGGAYIAWLGPGPEHGSNALWVQTPARPRAHSVAAAAGSPVVIGSPDGRGPVLLLWESGAGIVSTALAGQ
jgi:hypothetical protein